MVIPSLSSFALMCQEVWLTVKTWRRRRMRSRKRSPESPSCSVQNVLSDKISELKLSNPHRKVGLVAFEGNVYITGDGTTPKQKFGSQNMKDYDWLVKNGSTISKDTLSKSIGETDKHLLERVKELKPLGGTALGPGLLTAVAMAGEGTPGSLVILCTDGMATDGLGAFTGGNNALANEFYIKVGEYAKSKGVMVNMLFIQGSECNIQSLSKVSEITGGEVQRVTA